MTARKVAFITGCSSGFGLSFSIGLAKEGYDVIATVREMSRANALKEAAIKAGVEKQLFLYEMDVTNPEQVQKTVEKGLAQLGRFDVLINNAGFASGGFTEELPLEEWRRQFETNFFGVVSVTRAVLPTMRKQGSGKIINISSVSGKFGFPTLGPYVASKFALEGFSESLRLEMRPFGIDVILVEPGAYQTDIWQKGLQGQAEYVGAESPYEKKNATHS